jgi:hypothetical protein
MDFLLAPLEELEALVVAARLDLKEQRAESKDQKQRAADLAPLEELEALVVAVHLDLEVLLHSIGGTV